MQYRAYLMRVKKEKLQDYIDVHKKENFWEDLLEDMKMAGFSKMIIFQLGQDIILFEEADSLQKAYEYSDHSPVSKKWENIVSDWMEKYPEYNLDKKDIEFSEVPVVFYYKDGKLFH
jgi:L-rhamnose mutarotase